MTLRTSPVYAPWRERAKQFGIRLPCHSLLSTEDGWHGVLIVYAANPNAFDPLAIEVFQHLAEQIGRGVHALEQEQLAAYGAGTPG
jgi:hypothetical protein